MTTITSILAIGDIDSSTIQNIPNIKIEKCAAIEQLPDLILQKEYHLLIIPYTIAKYTITDIHDTLISLIEQTNSCTKILVITNSLQEEQACENLNLMFYPKELTLKTLIVQIIDTLHKPKTNNNLAIIDFSELLARVDNNKEFLVDIINQFINVKEDRVNSLKLALENYDFALATNNTHKLKGVLANFAMQKATQSAINLESAIKDVNYEQSLQIFQELKQNIDEAITYYHNNKEILN